MNEILNKIINNKEILDRYAAIDKINPFPFSHGTKHIFNVVALADKVAKIFNLNKREILILKVCAVLHDLGQVDGRKNHGEKAAEFAREYLLKLNAFSGDEVDTICSAIATHDSSDFTNLENKFSWFLILIDKMDFSRNRLESDSEKKFGYTAYQDISNVNFSLKEGSGTFIVNIELIENPQIISEELLYNYIGKFFNKVYFVLKAFCKHFGLKLDMQLQGHSLQLVRFEIKD